MPDELVLELGGLSFSGWERAQVKRSIETACGAFALDVSDENASGAPFWPVRPGTACNLRVGEDLVLVGYVDSARRELGPETHRLSAEGRDKAADLVDCTAMNEPGEWWGLTALELVSELAAPFDVPVDAQVADVGEPFVRFALQPGESAWEAIERACRSRGFLVSGNGQGGITLTQPGALGVAGVVLAEGENVRGAVLEYNASGRFRTYLVRGQQGATLDLAPEECAAVEGRAEDLGARPGRTLVIQADGPFDLAIAQQRAAWEATVRYARSARVTVRLAGWRERPDGALWSPNRLVDVRMPKLGITGRMLVTAVALSKGGEGEGTQAELELAWPDAFLPEVELNPEKDPGGSFGADLEDGGQDL